MDLPSSPKGPGGASRRHGKKTSGTLKRRHVLAAAGAAAGSLAAARVLWRGDLSLPASAATPRTRDWISPLDQPEAQVAHLLRRATFGATPKMHADAVRDGYARTVDRLVETAASLPPPFAGGDDATTAKPIAVNELRAWWMSWILQTPTPFVERMTLFWHGHFTSDYRKVGLQTPYIYWQNLTWRTHALGNLRSFLHQVTIDPAMLRYLDLGQSTGRAPNENYSRELMELFTLGPGAFAEDDVRAGARALAGWREPLTPALVADRIDQAIKRNGVPPRVTPAPDTVRTGVFEKSRSYSGPAYEFLGETRLWNTEAVLERILRKDEAAPFIVGRILDEFVSPDPAPEFVARLAADFRRTGYDLKSLMRAVLMSPEFRDASAYRALVKSPTEFMVSAARALEAPQLARPIVNAGPTMGQSLLDPPDVGGWPSNASWISSVNVLSRVNFVVQSLSGLAKLPPAKDAIAQQLDGVVAPKTAELLNATSDEATRWTILLASPEFQLK